MVVELSKGEVGSGGMLELKLTVFTSDDVNEPAVSLRFPGNISFGNAIARTTICRPGFCHSEEFMKQDEGVEEKPGFLYHGERIENYKEILLTKNESTWEAGTNFTAELLFLDVWSKETAGPAECLLIGVIQYKNGGKGNNNEKVEVSEGKDFELVPDSIDYGKKENEEGVGSTAGNAGAISKAMNRLTTPQTIQSDINSLQGGIPSGFGLTGEPRDKTYSTTSTPMQQSSGDDTIGVYQRPQALSAVSSSQGEKNATTEASEMQKTNTASPPEGADDQGNHESPVESSPTEESPAPGGSSSNGEASPSEESTNNAEESDHVTESDDSVRVPLPEEVTENGSMDESMQSTSLTIPDGNNPEDNGISTDRIETNDEATAQPNEDSDATTGEEAVTLQQGEETPQAQESASQEQDGTAQPQESTPGQEEGTPQQEEGTPQPEEAGEAAAKPENMCQPGWWSFLPQVDDNCYQFPNLKLPFPEAEDHCQQMGAHLPSLRTIYSLLALATFWRNQGGGNEVWIGLHKESPEEDWTWNDKETYIYTNWCNDDDDEAATWANCTVVSSAPEDNYCWRKRHCNQLYYFFCEQPGKQSRHWWW